MLYINNQPSEEAKSVPSLSRSSMTATPLPRLQLHILPLDGRPRLIAPPPTVGRPGNPEPQGRPGADRGIQSAAPRRPGVLLAHYLSDKTKAIRERYRAVSVVVRRRQIRYTLRHRARSVFRGAQSAAAATGVVFVLCSPRPGRSLPASVRRQQHESRVQLDLDRLDAAQSGGKSQYPCCGVCRVFGDDFSGISGREWSNPEEKVCGPDVPRPGRLRVSRVWGRRDDGTRRCWLSTHLCVRYRLFCALFENIL